MAGTNVGWLAHVKARLGSLLGTLGLCAAVAACATATPRDLVPAEFSDRFDGVEVAGAGVVRIWGDVEIPQIRQVSEERINQVRENRPEVYQQRNRTVSYLALSGGGADGAYGAGLLNGWTASGTRPEFEIVTGVSTGALMAPFAFLGSEYDGALREVYTQYSTDDLIRRQAVAGLLGGSSLGDSSPLRAVVAKYVDRKLFNAVAREHAKGRRLLVGTTNIDADRPVVWDMGRIAQRGTKQALELFRSVLLASASIPGVFPPVFIEVTAGGRTYQEMHVDGGTTDNTFLLPQNSGSMTFGPDGWKHRVYVIANSKTRPTADATEASTFAIAGRSISTLIRQQTEGDLIKLYLRAQKIGFDFNVTSIPVSFREKSEEPFDTVYMTKLYEFGYDIGRSGIDWRKVPAGI